MAYYYYKARLNKLSVVHYGFTINYTAYIVMTLDYNICDMRERERGEMYYTLRCANVNVHVCRYM